MAIARSKADPSFLTSAGARLTVIRSSGKSQPEFLMAAVTRSRLSRTAVLGSPTIENVGIPREISTSVSTTRPSIPTMAPENTVVCIFVLPIPQSSPAPEFASSSAKWGSSRANRHPFSKFSVGGEMCGGPIQATIQCSIWQFARLTAAGGFKQMRHTGR